MSLRNRRALVIEPDFRRSELWSTCFERAGVAARVVQSTEEAWRTLCNSEELWQFVCVGGETLVPEVIRGLTASGRIASAPGPRSVDSGFRSVDSGPRRDSALTVGRTTVDVLTETVLANGLLVPLTNTNA